MRGSIFILFLLSFCGCQSEHDEIPFYTAQILEITCGGTVLQFTSNEFGEDWLNYMDNGKKYENVVLTGDLSVLGFNEGESVFFNFEKVNTLDGNICDIGGLPSIMIDISNISPKI